MGDRNVSRVVLRWTPLFFHHFTSEFVSEHAVSHALKLLGIIFHVTFC